MELGVYSFGNGQQFDGKPVTTAQAIKNLLEAIQLADNVGLDFFGVGEHHKKFQPGTKLFNTRFRAKDLGDMQ